MKAKVLFWIWAVLCIATYTVGIVAFMRCEFYTVRFFWIFSLLFAALTLIQYVDIKTTDV